MPTSEVYNIDCIKYLKDIPDKFFELSIVDPPYGINALNIRMESPKKENKYQEGNVLQEIKKGKLNSGAGKLKNRVLNTMSCNWDFTPPTETYFKELFRVSKNQIIWGGNYFNLPPVRGIICWDKIQPWENFSQIELAWTSFNKPAALFKCSNTGSANTETKIHPTQKPIALYQWLIKKYANQGDKILDTHLGSGSSRIAAYKMGFDFYATEIDIEYFEAQEKRFKKECLGEIQLSDGKIVKQLSLF